jgi:hypothetical protein
VIRGPGRRRRGASVCFVHAFPGDEGRRCDNPRPLGDVPERFAERPRSCSINGGRSFRWDAGEIDDLPRQPAIGSGGGPSRADRTRDLIDGLPLHGRKIRPGRARALLVEPLPATGLPPRPNRQLRPARLPWPCRAAPGAWPRSAPRCTADATGRRLPGTRFLAPNEHPTSRHRLSSELGQRRRTGAEQGEANDCEHRKVPAVCHRPL